MPGNDDVVLRLIIKGQDPAEIQRLAAETSGRLAQESAAHIARLTQLHKAAAEEQSAAMKKAIDEEIKDSGKLLSAIQQIERQREIAANRAGTSWDAMLNRIKNVTIIAQGLATAFRGQAAAAFQLGEDIDRLTNVYGSLKGSIDGMREATGGEVANYDLIVAKNQALQMDLELTDKQFGIVGRAADNFADSLGTNTKEALDQLISGLATGKTKALEHAGAIKDVDLVYENFAKSIGTTSDRLSDQGKRVAVVEEALRNLDKKNKESGALVDDFSHRWEKFTAEVRNLADAFKIHLGEAILFVVDNLKHVGDALSLMKARFLDAMSFGHTDNYARVAKEIEARNDAAVAAEAAAQAKAASATSPQDFKYTGDRSHLIKKMTADEMLSKQFFPDYNRPVDEQGNEIFGGRAGQYEKDQALLDILGATARQHNEGAFSSEDLAAAYDKVAKEKGHGPFDVSMGFDSDAFEKQMSKVQGRIDQLKKEASDRGLLGILMFGPDGPDQLYSEMDALQQATVDMAGMISGAAKQMAEAVGQSLANWIADSQGARKSFRDVTNEMMVNLSAQAFTKGLFELAEAAASFATYNEDAGYKHLTAAAAYAVVGTAAGAAARAIGHSAPAASHLGGGTMATRPGARPYGSGSSSSSSSGSDNPQITFNLTVLPGGEAEAGRQINKALDAYYAQTGRGAKAAA